MITPDRSRAVAHYSAMAAEAALQASIAGALSNPLIHRRAQYVEALQAHDWQHQHSEDYSVVLRGAAERQALRETAAQIDREFVLWNTFAPSDMRNGARL